jgi:hypothetical protein
MDAYEALRTMIRDGLIMTAKTLREFCRQELAAGRLSASGEVRWGVFDPHPRDFGPGTKLLGTLALNLVVHLTNPHLPDGICLLVAKPPDRPLTVADLLDGLAEAADGAALNVAVPGDGACAVVGGNVDPDGCLTLWPFTCEVVAAIIGRHARNN